MTQKYALVFPGQGSQIIGMGKDLYHDSPIARKVFEEVDDVLQENLSHLMFEGTEEDLRLTYNAQPALMAVSIALLKVLAEESSFLSQVHFVAGHSLGEYAALCAADTFSLQEAAYLLKKRGKFMHEACTDTPGAMAAVLGLDVDTLQNLLAQSGQTDCYLANDNCPGQLVISGSTSGIEALIGYLQNHGAKRVIKLPVSGAFHSPLMVNAQRSMEQAFTTIQGKDPKISFVANQTARPLNAYPAIEKSLIHQMTSPVRWRETLLYFEQMGVTDLIELGSGKVLTNLALRTTPTLTSFSISNLEGVYSFIKTL